MHQVAPKHVLLGGCILAFGASFVNVGFVLLTGASVSHLTGDITTLAVDSIYGDVDYATNLLHVGIATIGFIVGATVSGMLLHHPQLELEKPYGRVITGIGGILLVAYFCQRINVSLPIALAGFSCGLQNALATKYRGSVLRTTHLTGLFTDLGVMLGMKLRGRVVELWRIGVPLFLAVSFFMGALCGALSILYFEVSWLALAGCAYVCGGIMWSVVKRRIVFPKRDGPTEKSASPGRRDA